MYISNIYFKHCNNYIVLKIPILYAVAIYITILFNVYHVLYVSACVLLLLLLR